MEAQNPYFLIGRNAFLSGDWKVARKHYKLAAKYGSVSAIHNLAVMFLHGQGCAVDYDRACRFFKESALYGICESMNQLGYMAYYGKGAPQDFFAARSWFLSSNMHGSHSYAQYHLGIMSALGQGVPQDWKEAAKWLTLSSDQGYIPATYNLGVLYFNGDGVKQSYDSALELYARAAVKGHAAGENNFAVMCAEGLGTLKRPIENVTAFYERAAAKNMGEAQFNLVNIHLAVDVPAVGKVKTPSKYARSPAKRIPSELRRPLPPIVRSKPAQNSASQGQMVQQENLCPQGLKIRNFSPENGSSITKAQPQESGVLNGSPKEHGSKSMRGLINGIGNIGQSQDSGQIASKSLPTRGYKPHFVPRRSSRRVVLMPTSALPDTPPKTPQTPQHEREMDSSVEDEDSHTDSTVVETQRHDISIGSSTSSIATVSYVKIRPIRHPRPENHVIQTQDHSPIPEARDLSSKTKKKVPLVRLASSGLKTKMPHSPALQSVNC